MVASWSRRASERGVTSRSTSRRRTETFFIFRPRIVPSRSRAIVSVSGNSGTARQLTPPNITSKLFALERNPLGVISRQLGGLDEIWRDGSYRQHPPASGHQFIGNRIASRAGMKHFDAFLRRRQVDHITGPHFVGITRCCNDRGD